MLLGDWWRVIDNALDVFRELVDSGLMLEDASVLRGVGHGALLGSLLQWRRPVSLRTKCLRQDARLMTGAMLTPQHRSIRVAPMSQESSFILRWRVRTAAA